ncbi:hypothetical protein ABQE93_08920 [Mycolicibacterium sp. XJ662]
MADDNEPTWGNDLVPPTRPDPAATPLPNQRSMPVVGPRVPPPAPQPHADYQRQAKQHFGAQATPAATPQPMSYPAVPSMPQAPPPQVPTPRHPVVPPVAYPAAPVRDSFIQRLMQRGVRGELIRHPRFQDMRQRNPDPFVYVSYAVGVVLSLLLSLIPSSFVVTVLTTMLWIGVGYLYFALGTKLAHQFVLFGICLVGALVMAARMISSMVLLSSRPSGYSAVHYESVAESMFVLLINLAGVAAFIYVGVQVHRVIRQMSQP